MTDSETTSFDLLARIESSIRMMHKAADFTTEPDPNFTLDVFILTKAILPDLAVLMERNVKP